MAKLIDLTGQRFDKLIVLENDALIRNANVIVEEKKKFQHLF